MYVLAAAVIGPAVSVAARTLMLRLRGSRSTAKLHWSQMDRIQRKAATEEIAAVDGLHLIAIGSPVPRRRQERARATCLAALVPELSGVGVRHMRMEARTLVLDQRDVKTVVGARYALPKGAQLRIDHARGCDDPLLWVADILAGAVRTHYDGDPTYRDILINRIHEHNVATGC